MSDLDEHPTYTDAAELSPIGNLRTRTARGTLINSVFQIGLAGLSLVQRLVVASFLTRREFGIWGLILAALITLVWLKQIGVADKYVQQSEPDQEAAFQKAFSIELGLSTIFFLLCCAAMPLYALAYGHTEIILPGLILASSVLLGALETPAWIPYRNLQYGRQRRLMAINPVVSMVATISLMEAGMGFWGLVAGAMIGSVSGAAVCALTSPYRLRWRLDRATVREYWTFSWPLFGLALTRLATVQGALLVANRSVGLAGVGAIGLAASYSSFTDGVDGIVSTTIYPAVCSVAHRMDRLLEVFVKSNRVALMWAMPFSAGIALFSGDLIHHVLGDRWEPARILMIAIALSCGLGQVAFNWNVFMRAANRTRPLFVAALVDLGAFFVLTAPLTIAFGLTGYAVAFAADTLVQIALRAYYMRQLFGAFDVIGQALRSVAPAVPPAAAILLLRLTVGGERTAARVLLELAAYALVAVASTYALERRFVRELIGYMRGRVGDVATGPTAAAGA